MKLLERIISVFSPIWAFRRQQNRLASKAMASFTESFEASSKTRRSMGTWLPWRSSPTAEYRQWTRTLLVSRSHDAYKNQPIARAAINRSNTNIIGTGLRLHSHIDYEILGMSAEEASEREHTIEKEFRVWAEHPIECDYEKTLDFYGLQALALVSTLLSGDVFVSTPHRAFKSGIYSLKLQLIEGDRVCNPNFSFDTETLKDGIEFSSTGIPRYYHVLDNFPFDVVYPRKGLRWRKVRIFGKNTGRRRILHLFDKLRPGQYRGIPYLAPVLEKLKQLDRYSDSELMSAVISSFFTVFVKTPQGQGLAGTAPIPPGGYQNINPHSQDGEELQLGEGLICTLAPGDDIEVADPKRPNKEFNSFYEAILKQIGAALEIPFEVLNLYFSASYSAARAALLEAWKFWKTRRAKFITAFCQPVYELWFDEAVAKGIIDAPGYADPRKRYAWTRASWIGQGRGAINELREAKAARERIDIGISSIAIEAAELRGLDAGEIHTTRVRERRIRKEADLEGELKSKGQNDGTVLDESEVTG